MRYNIVAMKKLTLYLDTSIISAMIDEHELEKKTLTQRLFDEIEKDKYEAYISELVTAEVDKSEQEDAIKLRSVINELGLEALQVTDKAKELADKYVKQRIIPVRYVNDAVHIAVATVNNLDVIVSWNFQHIVKVKTKIEVKGVNALMGYKEIEIYSPLEVVKNV
jgi:predicted nucleic acid-binding protein